MSFYLFDSRQELSECQVLSASYIYNVRCYNGTVPLTFGAEWNNYSSFLILPTYNDPDVIVFCRILRGSNPWFERRPRK